MGETKRKGARGRSEVTWPPHPSNPPLAAGPMKMLWCISSGALEIPSPVHPLNAGAPSSKLSAEDQTTDPTPMGQDKSGEQDLQAAESQPQEMLIH